MKDINFTKRLLHILIKQQKRRKHVTKRKTDN